MSIKRNAAAWVAALALGLSGQATLAAVSVQPLASTAAAPVSLLDMDTEASGIEKCQKKMDKSYKAYVKCVCKKDPSNPTCTTSPN